MVSLKVENTQLEGVLKITPNTIFEDFRGEYVETYNRRLFEEAGLNHEFLEDDISVSTKNVLRGFHGDARRTKLITCLFGKFYFVVVNNDPKSAQYRHWASFTMSDKNYFSILVPPNFGNAHLVLSERTIFHYKQTGMYDPDAQFTLKWNDPTIGAWWPVKNPQLSVRDE